MQAKCALVFLALFSLLSWSASAAPPNTAVLDGRPYEYDAGELRGTNSETPFWGADNVISNLYVTWDTNSLYVMLQGYENDRKLALLIDVDPGNGTGATTTTNWMNTGLSRIDWNGLGWAAGVGTAFGCDYMLASEGQYNNINRILYNGDAAPDASNVEEVFDQGNGSGPTGGAVDMVIQADGTDCTLKGFEACIPWTVLYNTNRFGIPGPGHVPTGATLRVFANIHENSENVSYSSSNAIPEQASGSWAVGLLTTASYIDIPLDADNDGAPDVAPGDVNAPWIISASGAEGATSIFVSLNEAVTPATAGVAANYTVNGVAAVGVTIVSPTLVQLDLAAPLPSEGSNVMVESTGLQDASGNAKANAYCLGVGPTGIANPVTVTFVLCTNSGFAAAGGVSDFFLTGDALPLMEGLPPATNIPLVMASGEYHTNRVTFPAGTPSTVGYRFAGILNGTNNYEAIRLDNYAFEKRRLILNDTGADMVVTGFLGAAASPARQGDAGYDALYLDPRRGDAGVRQRTKVLFQLDLSGRNLSDIQRVLVQGTDPLRGFNANSGGTADWAGGTGVGWLNGGLEMNDLGLKGDLVPGDGIYSREWVWSIDGTDAVAEPGGVNSLVGGDFSTLPYGGFGWVDGRSPCSFAYKFYTVDVDTDSLESPPSNMAYFIPHDGPTEITLDPFIWANEDLPKLSATNPATIVDIVQSGGNSLVIYTNITLAGDNALEMADEVGGTWQNYGDGGVGADNTFTVTVEGASQASQFYRITTPSDPRSGTWWDPHPVASGQPVTIYWNQNDTDLAGNRDVRFSSNVNGWSTDATPMTFLGNGLWSVTVTASSETGSYGPRAGMYWKVNPGWLGQSSGQDFCVITANQGISWTPNKPLPGTSCTLTYDATGGPLDGQAQVNIHWWVDGLDGLPGGSGGTSWPGDPMASSSSNLWAYTFTVPSNALYTVNFLFNEGGGSIKDENFRGDRNYCLFVGP